MVATKIAGRLQTPPDESGKRKDIHLINTTDEVIVNPDADDSMTLTEKLEEMQNIYTNIDTLLSQLQTAVGQLQTSVTDIEKQLPMINTLNDSVNNLNTSVSKLDERVTALEEKNT